MLNLVPIHKSVLKVYSCDFRPVPPIEAPPTPGPSVSVPVTPIMPVTPVTPVIPSAPQPPLATKQPNKGLKLSVRLWCSLLAVTFHTPSQHHHNI